MKRCNVGDHSERDPFVHPTTAAFPRQTSRPHGASSPRTAVHGQEKPCTERTSTYVCWNPFLPLGPVQVQTLEKSEPDLNSGSLMLTFRLAKFCEPDLMSGFRFCPRTDQTGLRQPLQRLALPTAMGVEFGIIRSHAHTSYIAPMACNYSRSATWGSVPQGAR